MACPGSCLHLVPCPPCHLEGMGGPLDHQAACQEACEDLQGSRHGRQGACLGAVHALDEAAAFVAFA